MLRSLEGQKRPVEVTDELLSARDMLPPEIAVRIGCVGCNAPVSGNYLLTVGGVEEKADQIEDLLAAGEITDIPVKVVNGPQTHEVGVGDGIADCATATQRCRDKENISLLNYVIYGGGNGEPDYDETW